MRRRGEGGPVLFVDPVGVQSPVRFIGDLTRISVDLESDLGRLDGRRIVFTSVDGDVAEAILEARPAYALLVTPQEDFCGLDQRIVDGAERVVVVGENPTLSVRLDGDNCEHLDAMWLSEDDVSVAKRPPRDAGGTDDALNLVFPHSYLDWWEGFVARGEMPAAINVLTDRRTPVPAWFEHKAKTHGCAIRTWFAPAEEGRFFLLPGRFLRDNPAVDAVDLALVGQPVPIHNVRLDADARDSIVADRVMRWSSVLSMLQKPGAPGSAPKRQAGGQGVAGSKSSPKINVVCFNPSYLFADLSKRFERKGCIHSDYPLPDADGYVWMRPQELAALADLVREVEPVDVPASYVRGFREQMHEDYQPGDGEAIESRSVAIHHGTCFPPIVQFDPYHLTKRIATAARVAGVCELDLCYGPSREYANRHNFVFVPIGYDHTIFTEELVRRETREAGAELQLGFVGRAYGSDDPEKLSASVYAHPKGYRKGGDHVFNVLLRLKARGVPFRLHIVGQNWDELVADCEAHGLPVVYYTRDKNIAYREFPKVFAGFDALLITARAEGGPVAAIEAMSVGAPVIGTDVGVVPYVARRSKHCRTFHYDAKWHQMDSRDAAEALAELSKKAFTHADRLEVRKSIAQHTTDRWVERLVELAREAAEEASRLIV